MTDAATILESLREHTDPERATAVRADRPTADEVLGLTVAPVRRIAREAARALRDAEPQEVVAVCEDLVDARVLEARCAAYELLSTCKAARASLCVHDVERLGSGLDNWVAVDTFGGAISGPLWLAGALADEEVLSWARSEDLWWRRVALVSTTVLNKKSAGGRGDAGRTLAVCGVLAADRHDMIVKALSWALRMLASWEPAAVAAFVEGNQAVLAARIKREVRTKLGTGRKHSPAPRRG